MPGQHSSRSSLLSREHIVRLLLETVVIVFSVLFALAVNGCRESAKMRQTVERVQETLRREVMQNQEAVKASLAHHEELIDQLRHGRRLLKRLPWQALDLTAGDLATPDQVADLLRPLVRQTGGDEATQIEVKEASDPDDLNHDVRFVARIGEEVVKVRLTDEAVEILGTGNISLRPANVLNTAWSTLQVSGAALALDYELLEQASSVHQLQNWYRDTVSKTVDLLYSGNITKAEIRPGGFLPTLQDIASQEKQLLQQYERMLELLEDTG